jgi:tRNA1Val (adenine37-N6)-methyltransferase
MFTYHYQQPSEYHFSLDSIQFAEFVAQHMRQQSNLSSLRVLDLCAGCGVIGIELSWYLRELKQFDFMEVQDIYTDYFKQNVITVNRPELELRWHVSNYDVLLEDIWKEKFDLIISNPPYFLAGHGTYSPSEFKNRCRLFLDSSFANFIFAMRNSLKMGGKAYFLLRPLPQHGQDVLALVQELLQGSNILVSNLTNIRGTHVVMLEKLGI